MSTDKQSEASPEDQVAECRRYAEAEDIEVPGELVFIDTAISGAVSNRPALLALLRALERRAFHLLLVYDGDRLAREESIFFDVIGQLHDAGCSGINVSTRRPLHAFDQRVLAVVASEQLKLTRASTKRGLDGLARRGYATGAPPYGYRTEKVNPDAPKSPSRYVIVEKQAVVVRRIFSMYARGLSMREIADTLNAESVPGPKPRGGARTPTWVHTAIREMLHRERYRGVNEYGKLQRIKRRDEKRTAQRRSESDVIRLEVPELRIIPEDLWLEVQGALAAKKGSRSSTSRAKPVHVLSTLLRCEECGAAFHAQGGAKIKRFACSGRRNWRPCGSTLRIPADVLHERVLGALGRGIADSDSGRRIIAKATAMITEALDRCENLGAERAELRRLDRKLRNTTKIAQDAEDDHELALLRDDLIQIRSQRRSLRDRIAAAEHAGEVDVEALQARLQAMLADLAALMSADVAAGRAALRSVIAEDGQGQRRLDVIADEQAHDGFRVEGTLRLPIDLNQVELGTIDGDPGAIRTRDP